MIKYLTKSQIATLHRVLAMDKLLPVDYVSVGYDVKYKAYYFYFLKEDRIKRILFMTNKSLDFKKVSDNLFKYFGKESENKLKFAKENDIEDFDERVNYQSY